MAVGQPETNLNTWGLRYVKKTRAAPSAKPSEGITAGNLVGDSPSQKIEEQVSSHGGRQSDSVGDTKGKKIKQPAETDPDRLQARVGRTTTQTTTGRREGATSTIGSKESKQEQHGQKHLTSEGKILGEGGNPKRQLGVGETASQDSGIRSPETRTGRTAQDKPAKTGGEGKTHGALPKVKAELDLAIIKCKLLKMNNIQKDFIEDSKPTRPQFRKDDEEDYGDVKEEAKKDSGDIGHGVPKPDDGTPQGKAESDKEIKDKKLDHVYRSEDIVDKAIELINEAYDEMKSTDFRKLKPIYEGDTKQAKKDAQTGEGSNKPSKRGDFKTDNRDLENSRNETSTSNLSEPASTMDQTPRDYEVTSSGKETGKKRVTNRPTNTFSPSPHQKEPQTSVEQADETAWDDANRKWNKQVDSTNWGKDSAGSLAPEKSPERQGKGALKTDGGTSTTSSEGSANFVYSDVKEAEKQKQ